MPDGGSRFMTPAVEAVFTATDYASLRSLNTALGFGSVVVFDKSADLVRAVVGLIRFRAHGRANVLAAAT